MRKVLIKIFDLYLLCPILSDLAFFLLIFGCNMKYSIFKVSSLSENNGWLQDIYSNLISTSISLAGFILAALTIIVTFRSSVKAKLSDEEFQKLNGLELILSTDHYKNILKAFKTAMFELIMVFVILLYFWLFQMDFNKQVPFYVLIYAGLAIALSTMRTLLVLFKILFIDK